MKKYNFDIKIVRSGTNSIKYDMLKSYFGREDVLPMWVADMDFETPDFIMNAISNRLQHPVLGYSLRPKSFNQAVASWMKSRFDWQVSPEEISFSPGVVTGIFLAMKAFTVPGDKIIVQPPVYFPFFTTIKANGREIVYNQLKENQDYYTMDFKDLISKIDDQTKMIFISNPHNPVGRAWKRDELETLVGICDQNNILIVSDEIHSDLVFTPHKHIPIASISEKAAKITLTLMAPSKTFNMAGLSTSMMIVQNPKLLRAYNRELEATHLNQGNIFGTVAAEAAYSQGSEWVDEMVDYIKANIDFVDSYISEFLPQIHLVKPEATYLLWLNMKSLQYTDNELFELFVKKAGLAINKGAMFGLGGNGYIRMNIAMPRSFVKEAMVKLRTAIEDINFSHIEQ